MGMNNCKFVSHALIHLQYQLHSGKRRNCSIRNMHVYYVSKGFHAFHSACALFFGFVFQYVGETKSVDVYQPFPRISIHRK